MDNSTNIKTTTTTQSQNQAQIQPQATPPVEHRVVYTEYKERKSGGRGCGFIFDILWRILTCIGCLLLLISTFVIIFAVWIHV